MATKKTTTRTKKTTKATKPVKVAKQPDTGETVAAVAKIERKPLSLLNAAAMVLEGCGRPMNCKEIIDMAIETNIWQPKNGKTPANTLYASILREISKKGADSRFAKADQRGKFELFR